MQPTNKTSGGKEPNYVTCFTCESIGRINAAAAMLHMNARLAEMSFLPNCLASRLLVGARGGVCCSSSSSSLLPAYVHVLSFANSCFALVGLADSTRGLG